MYVPACMHSKLHSKESKKEEKYILTCINDMLGP